MITLRPNPQLHDREEKYKLKAATYVQTQSNFEISSNSLCKHIKPPLPPPPRLRGILISSLYYISIVS